MRSSAVALVLVLFGCADERVLELVLVHDDAIVPSRDFTSADMIVIDLGDPDVSGDEAMALSWSGDAADLLAGVAYPDFDMLEEGSHYVAAVAFGAASGCVAASRVVGRSLTFVHDPAGDRVRIAVGCAEEIQPTRQRPLSGRIGHAAARVDGGALVVGGSARLDPNTEPYWEEPITTLERYDIASGSFVEAGTLSEDRVLPAVATLAGGEVAALGGGSVSGATCLDTIEVVWPAPRDGLTTLPSPRCAPSAASLENGNVAVHGGQVGPPTLTTLDPELSTVVDDAALSGTPRGAPQLIPLGDAVIAIGGDGFGSPTVAALLPGCGATGDPCSFEVPVDAASDPGPGWEGMTGSVVPCLEAGTVVSGMLYVTGGGVASGPDVEPETTLDTVFCTPLSEDVTTWRLSPVGTLPSPRRGHQTVVISDGSGETDLLLVGGVDDTGAVEDAALLEVRGCGCLVAETRTVSARGAPPLFFHSVTPMVDGTVLVVGGARPSLVDMTLGSVPYAGLYFPDVILP